MCLSDIGIIAVLLLTILSAKYNKISNYIHYIMAFCSVLIFWNNDANWSCNYFSYKSRYDIIRLGIMFAGSVLLYTNTILKRRVIITLSLMGSVLLLSSCNVFSLIFAMEFMVIPSYFWVYEDSNTTFQDANYFKYNALASMLLFFSAGILIKNFSTNNFEDIKFILSFGNTQDRFLLLMLSSLIAVFSIRIGLFFTMFDNIPIQKLSLIFCILIPISSLKIDTLTKDVFCYLDINSFLRIIGCITISYASILFYKSQKISGLLINIIAYQAGVVNLCCAMQSAISSTGLFFICLSELLIILGMVVFLIAIRKKFNKPLEEISDFSAFGFRHKKMGIVLSCLFLAIMGFPPSLNFLGKFYISLALIKSGYFLDSIVFILSLIPIIIRCTQTISKIWKEKHSAFFSVVNVKLINIVYVIIIMDIIVFPFIYGLGKFFGGYYVAL